MITQSMVFIGLGSNVGNALGMLRSARSLLQEKCHGQNWKESPIYKTSPVGKLDQDDFANQVVAFETSDSPEDLLNICKDIENVLGRQDRGKWGPREIDLDLLFYGAEIRTENKPLLPHPRLTERLFVLRPIYDIHPTWKDPVSGKTIAELLEDLENRLDHVAVVGENEEEQRLERIEDDEQW